MKTGPASAVGWARWTPALRWLRGDIVAGVTLTAYLLPAGIADASRANLPPKLDLLPASSLDWCSSCLAARAIRTSP